MVMRLLLGTVDQVVAAKEELRDIAAQVMNQVKFSARVNSLVAVEV